MKYINELTDNEKRALIENNTTLQNMVYDDMIESEMDFISAQIDYIAPGLRDYSIGAYNRNIIIVSEDNASDIVSETSAKTPFKKISYMTPIITLIKP